MKAFLHIEINGKQTSKVNPEWCKHNPDMSAEIIDYALGVLNALGSGFLHAGQALTEEDKVKLPLEAGERIMTLALWGGIKISDHKGYDYPPFPA